MRRAVALLVLAAALAGCGPEPAPPPAAPGPAPAAPTAPVATPPGEPPVRRSVELAQQGWRFTVDIATPASGEARVEVLAVPPTVGAAPRRWTTSLAGEFVEAFATDLDADGAPELLLWWRAGSAGEGGVEGWRIGPGAAAAALTLPALDGDLAVGWRGRDQFGVQGGALVRTYPLYRETDDNASPGTGFLRVVRYRLVDGALAVGDSALEPIDGTPQAELLAP